MKRDAVRYYTGTGTNTGDVMFTTGDNLEGPSIFTFSTSAGAATLEATLDGTNWTAMAFMDQTATTSTTFVTTTAAGKIYKLEGKFRQIRMKQSGATAATGIMMAGSHASQ